MTKLELGLEPTRMVTEARIGERSLTAAPFGTRHHRLLDGPMAADILGMTGLQGGSVNCDAAINRGRELGKQVDLKPGQYQAQAELARNPGVPNTSEGR